MEGEYNYFMQKTLLYTSICGKLTSYGVEGDINTDSVFKYTSSESKYFLWHCRFAHIRIGHFSSKVVSSAPGCDRLSADQILAR